MWITVVLLACILALMLCIVILLRGRTDDCTEIFTPPPNPFKMMSLDDLKQGHEDAKRMRRYQKKKQRSNRRKPKQNNKKEKFTDGDGDDNNTMDLRDFYTLPPVLDQKPYGTCVSTAASYAISLLLFQNGYVTTYGSPPSRLFLHFNSRVMCDTNRTTTFQTKMNMEGTSVSYMLKGLNLYAWCDEVTYPYTSKYAAPPDPNIYNIASKNMKYQIDASLIYTESGDEFISTAKNALDNHNAFLLSISCYQTSGYWITNGNGRFVVPNSTSKFIGGHAMLCIGYSTDAFIVENSWGMTGDAGFYHIPFDYITDGKKVPDFLVFAYVMEDITDYGKIRKFQETQMEFSLSFVPQLMATSKHTFYPSMFDFYSSSIYERAPKLQPPLLCTTPLTCTTQSKTSSTTPITNIKPLYLVVVPQEIHNGPAAFIKLTTMDATTITFDHFIPSTYETVVTYDNVTNMILTQSPTTIKCKNVKSITLRKNSNVVVQENKDPSKVNLYPDPNKLSTLGPN
jgi:C1A family cysteine protease